MTTDLAFTVFRIGFLVLLWLLVLAAVNTLRREAALSRPLPRGVATVPEMSRRSVLTAARTRGRSSTRNPMRRRGNGR